MTERMQNLPEGVDPDPTDVDLQPDLDDDDGQDWGTDAHGS